MLSRFDEYFIHQTPEPLVHHISGDRNVYDRGWFGGFARDESYYFGVATGYYPNRGIMDGAFSVRMPDGIQHSIYVSGRAPEHGTSTLGPWRLEFVEPMRRMRLIIDDNRTGVACDLMFTTRSPAVQEQRQVLWSGARRTMDATRYDQFGRWSGTIHTPDGDIVVDEEICLGIKDRSWGVRRFGEPEPAGPIKGHRPLFVWAPIFWDDHVTHAIVFDNEDGQPFVREAIEIPTYPTLDAVTGIEDDAVRRLATVRHRIRYVPGTRYMQSAELDLVDHEGHARLIEIEPVFRFAHKGVGYGHPRYTHGLWRGDLSVEYGRIDPAQIDPLAIENIHVQHLVRARSNGQTGLGIFEQFIIGPYAPAGFKGMLDGAP